MRGDKFVYFAERDGLIKIGCSIEPKKRVQALQAVLLKTKHGGFADERAEHKHFAEFALGHEWFAPAPELLAYIDSLPILPPPPEPIRSTAIRSTGIPRYVSIGVAAAKIGVNKATIRRWCDTRKIAYCETPGGRRLVSVDAIEATLTPIEPVNTKGAA